MSNKADFQGDVGQAVLGNVNEAPRLNNVVNLTMSGQARPVLTGLQRKMITDKVKEVVAIGDVVPLDVYRVLLTEFGAEKMDHFPRDRYKDAMALLDGWIAEAKVEGSIAFNLPVKPLHPRHFVAICTKCVEQAKQTKYAHLAMIVQTVVMVLLTMIFSWLLWFKPAEAIESPISAATQCLADGKIYSVGSQIKMPTGVARECLQHESGEPYWGTASKKRAK